MRHAAVFIYSVNITTDIEIESENKVSKIQNLKNYSNNVPIISEPT